MDPDWTVVGSWHVFHIQDEYGCVMHEQIDVYEEVKLMCQLQSLM